MTTRTFTHPSSGPVTLRVDTSHTDIRVSIGGVTHATLTLATDATSGPVHDLVEAARVEFGHASMALDLDDSVAGGGVTVISGGNVFSTSGSTGVVVTGSVSGGVSIVGGRVFIGGKEVTPESGGEQGATLTLTATLPAGSSLDAHTGSGDIKATGPYVAVDAGTSSGSIRVDNARTADLSASSGSIRIKNVETLRVHASSGSIRVGMVQDLAAKASSGSITVEHVRGQADVRASSGSVDVCYSGPEPRVHTSSGSKRVRNINPFRRDEAERW